MMKLKLNATSLEWAKKPEIFRPVEIVERYSFDGVPRLSVRILTGPEKGRIVSGISPLSLRDYRGEFLSAAKLRKI